MRSSRPVPAGSPPWPLPHRPWWPRHRRLTPHQSPTPNPILLYKAWRDVLGKDPAYPAQQIGDCVSFGHGHANDLLQCIEIALGEPAEYRETDTEFIYATSREVAGILGRFRRLLRRGRREGDDDDRHGEPGNAR